MGCGASSLRAQGHEKYKDEAAEVKQEVDQFMTTWLEARGWDEDDDIDDI